MKKFLALSMAAVMMFSIAACSKADEPKEEEETTTTVEETEAANDSEDTDVAEESEEADASEEDITDDTINISGDELTLFYADDSVELSAGNIHLSSSNNWVMDIEITNLDQENAFTLQYNRLTLNGYYVMGFNQLEKVYEGQTKELTMLLGSGDITDTPADFTTEIVLLYSDIDDRNLGDFTFVTDDYGYEEPDKTTEAPIVETEEASVYLIPEINFSDNGDKFFLNLFCLKNIEYGDDHDYVNIRVTNYSLNGSPYRNESANRSMEIGGSRCIFNPTGTSDMNKPANYNLDETTVPQTLEFDLELGSSWHSETYANVHVVLSIEGNAVSVVSVTDIAAE